MERLTFKSVIVNRHYCLKCLRRVCENGVISGEDGCSEYCDLHDCHDCGIQQAFDRLAAYEDTGLTPEEIKALQADNSKLHKLIDDLETVFADKPKEHNGDNNDRVHCRDCDYLNMDSEKPYCCHSRMSTNGLDDWCNFGTKKQVGG